VKSSTINSLDVKKLHSFLHLFLSGTNIPINASRRYHVIPTAIQTPAVFDRSLAVGETTKKLRPSAHPTSKAGNGLLACLPDLANYSCCLGFARRFCKQLARF
jgi:hypothetical protein